MSTTGAVLVRDVRLAWSYRFSFFFKHFGIVFSLVSTRFVADIVGDGGGSLDPYGGDYFSFALLGMAVQLMAHPALTVFRAAVRSAQITGTFEAMLATRAHPAGVILASGLYELLTVFVRLIIMVLIVGILLGAELELANLGQVVVVLAMTLAAFAGIGLLSTAFTIAFKQTEPFTITLLSLSAVVSGVLYPTSVLPDWLERIAPLLPLTHALEVTRGLFIEGASPDSLGVSFAALAGFALLLPVGLFVLMRSIEWAKRTGSLAHY